MQINPVKNISSVNGHQMQPVKKDRSDYYKWVSKNQVNEALKMSKGREVEDGKYKTASALANIAGTIGTLASVLSLSGIQEKAQISVLTSQTEEQAINAVKKAADKTKKGVIGFVASVGLLLAGSIINIVNSHKANKTANERGFLSQKDKQRIKGTENIYQATDMIYDSHVK